MVAADLAGAEVDLVGVVVDLEEADAWWWVVMGSFVGPATSASATPLTSMAPVSSGHGGRMLDTCPLRDLLHQVCVVPHPSSDCPETMMLLAIGILLHPPATGRTARGVERRQRHHPIAQAVGCSRMFFHNFLHIHYPFMRIVIVLNF
jgi:hypothetical protein